MCFHTKQTASIAAVEQRFKAKVAQPSLFQSQVAINGFDFPQTPIIKDVQPHVITHDYWGLIPAWAQDDQIKKHTLNARIETIAEKPAFRTSISQRCLVIANGFYEWQWHDSKGKNKTKYEIGLEQESLFAFAGIYSHWMDPKTLETRTTYAILTTEANVLMAQIHNVKKRMPVILKPNDELKWLQHHPIADFAFPYKVPLTAKKEIQNTLF
ncbi:MAG: SOS response-associated peptidase [Flavobacterium sp.]